MDDRLDWKLHISHHYTVQLAYNYKTTTNTILNEGFNHVLRLKAVRVKVDIFVWRLFLNRLAMKENLCW